MHKAPILESKQRKHMMIGFLCSCRIWTGYFDTVCTDGRHCLEETAGLGRFKLCVDR